MKRQSGNQEKCERSVKKKTKGVEARGGEVTEEKAVAEERKEVEEATATATAEWCSWWSGVDEEMPWATSWIPFWEVEADDALYGDVLWDYDIWDLRGITPNPS